MKNKNSVDAKEAQLKVSNAMGDITRAAKKVLVEYLYDGFVKHFAKAIAYLEVDDAEADDRNDHSDESHRFALSFCMQ